MGRMSVTMTEADGLTVFTVTSDPKSAWPPVCQMLKALCYNPMCCSVSQRLRRVQGTSQSALGATQIMVGIINICLGTILGSNNGSTWQLLEYWYPFWFGVLFVAFGIVSILSEKYHSPCLVIASVIANLAGVAFAIAAIILYRLNFLRIGLWWLCQRDDNEYWYGQRIKMPPTPSVVENIMLEKCMEGKAMVGVLLQSITLVLIIMSVLELCLVISSAVLGIKCLMRSKKEENKAQALMTQISTKYPC
ncbi:transmembrane protein 176l.4 isoform X2 [Siniperca chuatsi]|uniref:transmembrane protein 176l.4 isoform X2 n=1 Tax=Siniperca chuatsi TaxID=119488 RepID=UPI001CE10965|nr:transmembrane protein 176l.4 isoform X2 [Siniperca chuatsi]